MKEFRVNNLITLRLIDGKTVLFVNNQEFKQCKILLLNIPLGDQSIEEINSIDEIAEKLDFRMENEREYVDITEEEEFMGHCSNLQAWAENFYNTDLLHKSLAFPLLKALSEKGNKFAKQRFAEEIARRYKYGNETVRKFLSAGEYLSCLTNENIINGILFPEEAIFLAKIIEFGERYEIVPYFAKMKGISSNKSYISLQDGKINELEIRLGWGLNQIPREIENLSNLKTLYISVSRIYDGNLFEEEFSVPSVKRLVILWTSIEDLPDSFYYFPNLEYLRIRGPEVKMKPTISFEDSFKKLANLRELDLYSLDMKKLPDSIMNLKRLVVLSLYKTTLRTLPVSLICNLSSLRTLKLLNNHDLEIENTEIEKLKKKFKDFKLKFAV
ncbi:hypothetical protein LCGC14_0793960 [marine sediment metagenome]|uniref:Leucine-rich repeat domain-containing protein n=1 Tax=marine sediment metagenome TaxID=412755 RepID=A0A0F9PRQ6_9ZZZZ|nr:MAG: hypothetical protein Lokiarch_24360 [Candidatus Lokiarchaeum sp. GC14_75]